MLPNVVYVGMGKAGSTLLHKLFLKHPDIYVSESDKEINFFSSEVNWNKGVEWYESQFADYQGQRWVADISPGYHNKIESVERMKSLLCDDLKILFTFRRFTDFAYSRYLHTIRAKMIRGGFIELMEVQSRFFKPLDTLVSEYVNAFGSENVLIMHYEREFDRRAPSFEQVIYEYLGLPTTKKYYDSANDQAVNSGFVPRFVHAKDKAYVEVRDGVEYVVPPDTLVFCCGRTYKDISWKKEGFRKVNEIMDVQKTWTTCLDEDTYEYVQKNYTEPLARRLEDKLKISFQHWYVGEPKRLEYPEAPLPDAYISDPALRSKRMAVNETQTPWT